jgi:ATP-dependent DNA helicase PIF1
VVNKEYFEKMLDETVSKTLVLKVGAQVMLRANLDIDNGLANGSRGVVVHLTSDSVTVKWKNRLETIITPYAWLKEDKDGKFIREQIPLMLAWSTTIHKIQGLTLDYAICDLGFDVFCAGQSYVSLSRVRTSEGLLLSNFDPKSIIVDKTALDFVNELEDKTLADKLLMVFHD